MRVLWASVLLGLGALRRAKLRAFLTTLGILIGIASVVVITALGRGARERVGSQISSLGSNLMFVWSRPVTKSGVRQVSVGLTDDDAKAIAREATAVSEVAVYSDVRMQVSSEYGNDRIQVIGANLEYFPVRSYSVQGGRLWTRSEQQVKARVCLIGATASEKLFGGTPPIGRYLRIGRHPFRVVGTLTPKGQSPFEDQDDRIIMPIGSWRARVRPTVGRRVQLVMATAKSASHTDAAVRQVKGILRQRHRIQEGAEDDFRVRTQAAFQEGQDKIYSVLTALLVSVAAVSLFVGGVGVMNIMLVSVTERTREIGIRMAIGARKADIQLQFLAESITLTAVGGLAGIALAAVLIEIVKRTAGWSMSLGLDAVGLALGTSVVVGLVFGILPARAAANLDPIEALRHE